MTQPRANPHLLVPAAELLAHRARLRLQEALGEQPEGDLPLATLGHRLSGPEGRAWARLKDLFGLEEAEADLLSLALAVAIEPALGPLVARAQGAEGRFLPTEPLVKSLHGHPARPIWRPTSTLSIWRLVTPVHYAPGEAPGYQADRVLTEWMFGRLSLDAELVLALDSAAAGPAPREWPVEDTARRLEHALTHGAFVRLVVQARNGAGRQDFAVAVARELGHETLVVDPSVIPQTDWAEAFMLAQRFALFADAALFWRPESLPWPAKIPTAPLQFLAAGPGQLPPGRTGTTDIAVALPDPGVESKSAILATLAPAMADVADRLASTPGLLLGDLKEVAQGAPRSVEEASADLRSRARARMTGAGHVVDPVFDWDDLIAPRGLTDQLRRITFEARTRPKLMERPETARLYHRSAGLSALFSGPPGVGKSMAAHVIARDLGSNLLIVDLGATTSKFIGETAKRLTEAFAEARTSGAALIFEEADAFFARRTEVQNANDRYANTDTNHLLQLLEAHDGLVLLSTNKRGNIDPAFIRRLRHIVEFPKPGPDERHILWTRMIAGLGADPAPLNAEIRRLAADHDLSPAQIKAAALSALYSAMEAGRRIEAGDLKTAAARELAKEGRAAPPPATRPRRQRSPSNG
jgi:hypothetical protein